MLTDSNISRLASRLLVTGGTWSMKLNANQLKRVAQHLNSLRIDEKYRKVYLGCLDASGGRRPANSDCAKAELAIAQKVGGPRAR